MPQNRKETTMPNLAPNDEPENTSAEELAVQFIARCVGTWAKYGQPQDVLAGPMLAWAINTMITEGEPENVALLLHGLAVQISPSPTAGHA